MNSYSHAEALPIALKMQNTNKIGGSKWVVKAQIHSGARGKRNYNLNDELEVAQATDK